jgi:phosphatidylglycerol:prolipoprotein diacylglycerol transferase
MTARQAGTGEAQESTVSPTEDDPQWIKAVLAPVVAATYWFDPGDRGKPYTARIKFTGRRVGVGGKAEAGDRFERIEKVAVLPGSGLVSVTTRAVGVDPGEWLVTAELLMQPSRRLSGPAGRPRSLANSKAEGEPSRIGALLRWGTPLMSAALPGPIRSRLGVLAPVPGSLVGSWPAFVGLGALVGLSIQAQLLSRAHLNTLSVLGLSLAAAVAGLIGAKVWYMMLNRQVSAATLSEGLCIQGFIAGAAAVLLAGLLVLHLPVGKFVDATVPGLLVGMAIGRPGCFLTGCCAGRPTASRWGIWASDRRVGARRIPVQLWEALLALILGLGTLLIGLQKTINVPGAIALGGLAAYTLGRQILFAFRLEPRRAPAARWSMMAIAVVVLASDVLCWVVTCL